MIGWKRHGQMEYVAARRPGTGNNDTVAGGDAGAKICQTGFGIFDSWGGDAPALAPLIASGNGIGHKAVRCWRPDDRLAGATNGRQDCVRTGNSRIKDRDCVLKIC